MPEQSEIDKKDEAAKARVEAGNKRREARKKFFDLKRQYKIERANNANSTKTRREIKENYKKNLAQLKRQEDANKSLSGTRIGDDSIDRIERVLDTSFESIPSESGVEASGWMTARVNLCIDGEEMDATILVRNTSTSSTSD